MKDKLKPNLIDMFKNHYMTMYIYIRPEQLSLNIHIDYMYDIIQEALRLSKQLNLTYNTRGEISFNIEWKYIYKAHVNNNQRFMKYKLFLDYLIQNFPEMIIEMHGGRFKVSKKYYVFDVEREFYEDEAPVEDDVPMELR